MNNIYKEIKEVSEDLHLNFETQDWGIINSNPSRLKEFIDYRLSLKQISTSLRYELLELIIASFNEAMLENSINSDLENELQKVLDLDAEICETVIQYWKSIYDKTTYLVGEYL